MKFIYVEYVKRDLILVSFIFAAISEPLSEKYLLKKLTICLSFWKSGSLDCYLYIIWFLFVFLFEPLEIISQIFLILFVLLVAWIFFNQFRKIICQYRLELNYLHRDANFLFFTVLTTVLMWFLFKR